MARLGHRGGRHQFALLAARGALRWGILGGQHDVSNRPSNLILCCRRGGLGGAESESGALASHRVNRTSSSVDTSVDSLGGSENLLGFDSVEPEQEQEHSSSPSNRASGRKIMVGTLMVLVFIVLRFYNVELEAFRYYEVEVAYSFLSGNINNT